MWFRQPLRRSSLFVFRGANRAKVRPRRDRWRPLPELLEGRRLLSATPPSIPQHNPSIRIAELAYSGNPMGSFEDQLLQQNVDLVVSNPAYASHISQVAPSTPQLIYSNVSNLYQDLLLNWDNYAEARGISPEAAFYHVSAPTPFSGNSSSSQPANWFWAVYNSGSPWTNNTSAAHGAAPAFPLVNAGQATYIGYPEEFAQINLQLASPGSNWRGTLQYPTAVDSQSNPTAWANLPLDTDTTRGLSQSGRITFAPPSNWVPATINGYGRLYYVRIQAAATGSGTSTPPVVQSLLGDDYVHANGGTSGTIPAYDYAADVNHDGYLNDAEYATAVAVGDTARFAYQSRLFCPGYGQMRFATDPSNAKFRAWAIGYEQGLLAANPLYSGIFMDNSAADPQIPAGSTIESTATYAADYGSLLGAIDQAIGTHWILPNVAGGYQDSEIPAVQGTSAYFEEFMLRPLADSYKNFLNNAALVSQLEGTMSTSSVGVIDSRPDGGSPTDPRTQLATLAEYYLLEVPNSTYLDFFGGYAPATTWSQHWSPAAAYDIGQPTANWSVFASGTDPSNPQATYYVYQRPFQGGLVLYKPLSFQSYSVTASIGDNSATTFALPGTYRPLNADGTLGSPITSITLDNGQGAILIPVAGPPTANNDGYTTPPGTTLTVTAALGVLANDTDPVNAPLTAALVSGPSDGTLKFNADGSFTYVPAAGYVGTDTFTYRDSDGNYQSGPATVTIAVAKAPSVADPDYTACAGMTLVTTAANGVLAGATDPNGLPLQAILKGGPAHGTLTLNADGSFTYTPAAGFTGTDGFTFAATDGIVQSNAGAVTIYVQLTGLQTLLSRPFDATAVGSLPAGWSQWSSTGTASFAVESSVALGGPNGLGSNGPSNMTARAWFNTTFPANIRVGVADYLNTLIPMQVFARGSNLGTSSPSYYAVTVTRGMEVDLVKVVNGQSTTIATLKSASYFSQQWVDVTLDLSGPVLSVSIYCPATSQYLNASGQWQSAYAWSLVASDGSIAGGGRAGLARLAAYAGTADFDNFTVSAVALPPVVTAGSYTSPQGQTLSVGAAAGVLAGASDPQGGPLTAALVNGPANGTLALNADGSFTYAPSPGFWGTDTFIYDAVNAVTGLSAPATVVIAVSPITMAQSFDTTAAGSLPSGWSQWSSTGAASFAVSGAAAFNGIASLASNGPSNMTARTWYDSVLGPDVQVSAAMDLTSLVPMQMFTRGMGLGTTAPTYYGVNITRGLTAQLIKVVNGQTTVIAALTSKSYFSQAWAQVTLGAWGSTLEVQVYRPDTGQYLNGSGQWQTGQAWGIVATDSSIAGGGQVGLGRCAMYAGAVYFDNFSAIGLGTEVGSSMVLNVGRNSAAITGIMALPSSTTDPSSPTAAGSTPTGTGTSSTKTTS